MKSLKKIIIFLSIIILIVIFILVFLLRHENENHEKNVIEESKQYVIQEEKKVEEVFNQENIIQEINSKSQYFNIKKCIERYKLYIANIREFQNKKDKNNLQTAISQLKSLIPEFVIKELEINDNNIYEKIGFPDAIIRIDNLYKSRQTISKEAYNDSTNIVAYIAKLTLINQNNIKQQRNMNLILILDENNCKFLIIPQAYIENKKMNIEKGNALNIYQKDYIEDYRFNSFEYSTETQEDMALEFLNLSKYYLQYDIDYLYNKMSEKYRTKRFGNIDTYRQYLKANYDNIKSSAAQSYLTKNLGETTQYVIKDQYENLYIFDAKSPVDFTIRLDTYTLDEEKFNVAYDQGDVSRKCQMNIDKFFQMINRQDFKTSFTHLADSFKTTSNMKKESDFEKISKQIFWQYNKVEYLKFDEIGNNTYMFNLKLTDITGKDTTEKNVTIIMQLNENREFVMSFS